MSSNFKITLLNKIGPTTAEEICLLMKQHVPDLKKLSADFFKKLISNKKAKVFVALNSDGKIIGIITMIVYHKVDGLYKGYIEDFVVNEADRRKGIGLALIDKALKTAKKMGVNTVHLTSHASRKAANSLYKKIGFELYETNYFKYNY